MRGSVAVGALVLLCAAPAWCQEAGQLPAHGPSYYLLRAVLSLVVVIALILVTYHALQKLRLPQAGARAEGPLELLQVMPVSAGRFIYLVGLGKRVYVIAWSQEGCALIGELNRAEMEDDTSAP